MQGEDHEAGIEAAHEILYRVYGDGERTRNTVRRAIAAYLSCCPSPEKLVEALRELTKWAEAARGHYGIEECSGPGQSGTEWDEVQDGLRAAAMFAREALSEFTATPKENMDA